MREGRVLLALPQPANQARPRPDAAPVAAPAPPVAAPFGSAWPRRCRTPRLGDRRAVPQARVAGRAAGFLDGRLLSLPRTCLTQATLETQDGQVLATGKFGEAEGCHAIRLRDPASAATDDGMVPVMGQAAAMMAAHARATCPSPTRFAPRACRLTTWGLPRAPT
ncbi:hypothetical protein FLP41_09620 [Paracoccus marcusii]|uniref:hypothetical protein n=1 Tax=Paracoccus marcusii TaxID=59779 RepID=UPI002ED3F4DA|nr:hypothetical protein FLP41_09620 [Paracoccus marcusii]